MPLVLALLTGLVVLLPPAWLVALALGPWPDTEGNREDEVIRRALAALGVALGLVPSFAFFLFLLARVEVSRGTMLCFTQA